MSGEVSGKWTLGYRGQTFKFGPARRNWKSGQTELNTEYTAVNVIITKNRSLFKMMKWIFFSDTNLQ